MEVAEDRLQLDHLGVAVRDLESQLATYQALGLTVAHQEHIAQDEVAVAFVPFVGGRFEFLAPTADSSPVARFLDKRGPGLHHVALTVTRLAETLERLAALGVRLIDQTPRQGAEGSQVAFIHPSATGGVLLELVQRPEGSS